MIQEKNKKTFSKFVKLLAITTLIFFLWEINPTQTKAFDIPLNGTYNDVDGEHSINATLNLPLMTDNESNASFGVIQVVTAGDVAIIIGIFVLIIFEIIKQFRMNI
jgi:hypothetical protein